METHADYIGGAFKITGNWNNQAKRLKHQFRALTDADLFFKSGMEKELLRRIETKLNKRREEVIEIIKSIQYLSQIKSPKKKRNYEQPCKN